MAQQERDKLDNLIKSSYSEQMLPTPPDWDALFGERPIATTLDEPAKRGVSIPKLIAAVAAVAAIVVVVALSGIHKESLTIEQIIDDNMDMSSELVAIEQVDKVEMVENGTLIGSDLDLIRFEDSGDSKVVALLPLVVDQTSRDSIKSKCGQEIEKKSEIEEVVKEDDLGSSKHPFNHQSTYYHEESFVDNKSNKFRLIASSSMGATGRSNSMNSSITRTYNSPAVALGCYNFPRAVDFYPDEYRHKMPINATVQLAYSITSNLWLSGGFSYSLLESTAVSDQNNRYHLDQQVSYIGIPVAVNYDLYRVNNISIYSALTLSPEWIVSQKRTVSTYQGDTRISTETFRDKTDRIMLYSSFGCGVKWDIIDRLSLFVEPNISSAFADKSHPITIRNSSKVTFNFNAGLQINL